MFGLLIFSWYLASKCYSVIADICHFEASLVYLVFCQLVKVV